MNLYTCNKYLDDVQRVCKLELPWEKLNNKSVMLSGATGLIGSFFVDVLLEKNKRDGLNCTIYALGRNEERAKKRFCDRYDDPFLVFVPCDVKHPLDTPNIENVDYLLHLASNTHPVLYSTDPIGTIETNIIGLNNLLNYAVSHNTSRFVFASSNEIYGENRGDVEFFDEEYCGYINSNTLRAGYTESKRCGEALCQAYMFQNGLDIIIARITRTYGPTMNMSDTKAINQFIKKGIEGKDIVLKSLGTQYYSFTYVADAVSGILTMLFSGKNGEAYNIADEKNDIMLKDLALMIAQKVGRKVVMENPDETEMAGFSKVTKARLSGEKLKALGWKPMYNMASGIEQTIDILKMFVAD